MQSETYTDGRELHQVFKAPDYAQLRRDAAKLYNQAMEMRFGKLKTIKQTLKIGRNDLCPCGSGRKFKKCHIGVGIPERPKEQ